MTATLYYLFLFALIAFSLRAFITPAIRHLALHCGWVDAPEKTGRKLHNTPIPYLGGVSIFIGILGGLCALLVFFPQLKTSIEFPPWIVAFLVGGGLILAVGTLDDIYDIPPIRKLAAQILIAILVFIGGVVFDHMPLPLLGVIEFGQWSVLLTIIVLVGAMNAINLIDGIDGLAASVGLLSMLANAVLAFQLGDMSLFFLCLLIAAALFGFLLHNFYPATIFLGDGGSLLIGFIIGVVSIQNVTHATTFAHASIPVLAFLYPVLDVGMAMFRRILKGKPVMSGDRSHIHHRLLEMGFTQRQIVILICSLTLLGVLAGMLFIWEVDAAGVLILTVFTLTLILGMVALNYFDVAGVQSMVKMRPLFRQHNAYKRYIEVRMRYAESESELWDFLVNAAKEFQLLGIAWKEADTGSERKYGQVFDHHKGVSLRMEKTGGEVYLFYSLDIPDDLRVEIDALMRSIVRTMDLSLKHLRFVSPIH